MNGYVTINSMVCVDKMIKDKSLDSGFSPIKICYESLIMFDIIEIEDFDKFEEGLKKIYNNFDAMHYEKIEGIKKELLNLKSNLFNESEMVLPFISNKKLSLVPWARVFHDLGEYVHTIQIRIRRLSPSYLILQIHIILTSKATDELNEKLIKEYDIDKKITTTAKGAYTTVYEPKLLKEGEIKKLRKKIKKDVVEFLSKYIEGYFINNNNSNYSSIPSIDVFSHFKDINEDMLDLFSTAPDDYSAKCKYGLFLKEKGIFTDNCTDNLNYLIFVKCKENKCPNEKLIIKLTHCHFDLLAIKRRIELEEEIIGFLNKQISQESNLLKNSDVNNLIDNRSDIEKKLFSFERFNAEMVRYMDSIEYCNLKSLNDEDYFDVLKKGVIKNIETSEKLFDVLLKHSKSILDLKNIESTNKLQQNVWKLSVIVAVLTAIQAVLTFIQIKDNFNLEYFSGFLSLVLFGGHIFWWV